MKKLLVVSSGRCVWDDVEKISPNGEYDILAVNDMIMYWPGELKYAVSWHYDLIKKLVDIRTYRKRMNRPITYGPLPFEGVDCPGRFYEGGVETSGMYGACIGLHLGYDKILLAGVPFDYSGHFYDSPSTETREFNYVYPATKTWDEFRGNAKDRVRAISGSLIKCFGELTEEWLKQ